LRLFFSGMVQYGLPIVHHDGLKANLGDYASTAVQREKMPRVPATHRITITSGEANRRKVTPGRLGVLKYGSGKPKHITDRGRGGNTSVTLEPTGAAIPGCPQGARYQSGMAIHPRSCSISKETNQELEAEEADSPQIVAVRRQADVFFKGTQVSKLGNVPNFADALDALHFSNVL
jgi:hypothetical protein